MLSPGLHRARTRRYSRLLWHSGWQDGRSRVGLIIQACVALTLLRYRLLAPTYNSTSAEIKDIVERVVRGIETALASAIKEMESV